MSFFNKSVSKNGELDLTPFIVDKELIIPKKYWADINKQFEKDDIKEAIVDLVETHSLPLPKTVINNKRKSEAMTDFQRLIKLDTTPLIKNGHNRIKSRHEYKYSLSKYYIETSTVGNSAPDLFHRDARMQCGTFKFLSPYAVWTDPDKLYYVLNALWSLKCKEVNSNFLYNCMALRQYSASQFRVSAAKAIYDLFKPKRVLDTSSGWGDRFTGFSASKYTEQYFGIDPNSALHNGYLAQGKMYNSGKDYNFACSPAEDVVLPFEYFDLMFTSPPYFETERYSEEETQSWKRHGTFDAWLNNFLFVVIDKTWKALRTGGYLALNIADLGVSYSDTKICDAMNDYISKKKGANYVGCLGLRLVARPKTGLEEERSKGPVIFIEPIWIWRKGGSNITLDKLVRRFKYKGSNILNKRVELKS